MFFIRNNIGIIENTQTVDEWSIIKSTSLYCQCVDSTQTVQNPEYGIFQNLVCWEKDNWGGACS